MNMLPRKNITLCGVKHAGKTSAAKALSVLTGMPFFDTDDMLKEYYNRSTGLDMSVREIFLELGETGFRQLEVKALRMLFSGDDGIIIALGGGVLSNPFSVFKTDNVEFASHLSQAYVAVPCLPPYPACAISKLLLSSKLYAV